MFEETLVVLSDATLSGDQVLDAVARVAPPHATVDIMGVQNIKGSGLDFVYRWVSLDTTTRLVERLRTARESEREAILNELTSHGDWGLVDASWALGEIRALKLDASADLLLARLDALVTKKKRALDEKRKTTLADSVRAAFGKTFDYLDSVRRQDMARRVVDDLVAARISHAHAAMETRAIVARAKGAWAQRRVR